MKLASVLSELAKPQEERTPDRDFDLKQVLYEFLISPEHKKLRATGSFNPSQLETCRRAQAYNYLRAPISDIEVEPRLMITFELGHYIHERFQALFERVAERNGWAFVPEMRVIRTLNPWYVSGRCDGVFLIDIDADDDWREGLEIKSIHKEGFNRLYDRPLYEHQFQGNTYQGLLKFNRMHYMYVCKDNSQIKIFAVPFDRELFETAMMRIERILLRLKNGKLPKRIKPDCRDPKCKFHGVCWSGNTVDHLLSTNHEAASELRLWRPSLLRAIPGGRR